MTRTKIYAFKTRTKKSTFHPMKL